MQSGVGDAPSHCAGDVDEVAVSVRACPDHRVAEHDRVRLGPRNLVPKGGTGIVDLVGRAGEGRPAAEAVVGVHQAAATFGVVRGAAPQLRMEQIHEADVQAGRHRHAGAAVCQADREVQRRLAVVEARIHVCPSDGNEAAGT